MSDARLSCRALRELCRARSQKAVNSGFAEQNLAVQSQKAVSAYFTSEQMQPFGFAEQNCYGQAH